MVEEIVKAAPVFFFSMLKFIFGPVGGFVAGLNPITTVIATVGGMMLSVVIFTFFGSWLRPRIKQLLPPTKPRPFSQKRWIITVWQKYGIQGIALLTPLLLTPIGGTILVVGFGASPHKIIVYMLVSGLVWGTIFTAVVYIFGQRAFDAFL